MPALSAKAFSASVTKAGARPARRVVCNATQPELSRRNLLAAGAVLSAGAALVSPLQASAISTGEATIDVTNLSSFQRADERADYLQKAIKALSEVLDGDDAAACVRLVFNDAGTYDEATKSGGLDGSIVLSSELDRPENAMLKPTVEKLKKAKAVIDATGAKTGAGPISWADLIVLAGRSATIKAWNKVKTAKLADPTNLSLLPQADWPVVLGRVDSAEAAPAGRIPSGDASVDEIKDYLLQLGAKKETGGLLVAKPPFWERPGFVMWSAASLDPEATEAKLAAGNPVFAQYKKKYDSSRKTFSRTDYEVDFINYYNKLSNLGAKFDPNAYLFPLVLGPVKL